MRKGLFPAIAVALASVVLGEVSFVQADACVPAPVITRRLPRYPHGWVGSAYWHDGVIYEVTDSTTVAIMKDAETGAALGTLNFKGIPTSIQGISYNRWDDTWWLKVHEIHEAWEYYWNGNPTGRKISTRSFALQVYVDPDEENMLWVGDSVNGGIRKINFATNAVIRSIPTNFGVRSVVRFGDYLWCTRMGKPWEDGILIKINMSGQEICRYYLPQAQYDHDAGGGSMDDEGQLWVEGGKETNIYRIDVGYDPGPTPSPTPIPAVTGHIDSGDYDGDGTSDIAVFRPGNGLWAVRGLTRCYFGDSGSLPVSGDYNGDGTSDIAMFKPSTAGWSIRGLTRFFHGVQGDYPVPGDYNGWDRAAEAAIFRPSSGLWAVRGLTRIYYGQSGDMPVPGYFSASWKGVKYPAVFRSATGQWLVKDLASIYFGTAGDAPAIGDYSGDWVDDIAIFRSGTGLWAVRGLTRRYFGQAGDDAVPADYLGSGTAQVGVFRPSMGKWAVDGLGNIFYGASGDLPASGRRCFSPASAGDM